MKFWNLIKNEAPDEYGSAYALRLDGPISTESWWGDEVTPAEFRAELAGVDGDLTVWINSPGGDVFAASEIYNMLKDFAHNVTVKVDALAASAASVVAMAGDTVYISPTGLIMIHNPSTIAMGDKSEMEAAIKVLDEVKESIVNAYMAKTGLSHAKISRLMDDETWMNANKAVELGFADKVLFQDDEKKTDSIGMSYSRFTVVNSLEKKFAEQFKPDPDPADTEKEKIKNELTADLWKYGV